MPANSWPENDSYNELWSNLQDAAETEDSEYSPECLGKMRLHTHNFYQGRRRKAAIVLTLVWSGTIALHLLSWGIWLVVCLTSVMAIHGVFVLRAKPAQANDSLAEAGENQGSQWPLVSLLVAAKNEETVIHQLVETLCNLDYPADRYELWVIDDASTDSTPTLLDQLAQEYPQLKVFHRAAGAGGGKSGALNQVIPLTKGEILGIFDADAQVASDILHQVLPVFERSQVGAVQMQKAVANPDVNFWTKGQVAEMAFDSYLQRQRVAIGGIGELRGNGQFIRRLALNHCGGFNEETITDDLDLTLRLHLQGWDIEFTMVPVNEEGVTHVEALWHQRNRWAEGGYQRYLDYFPLIVRNRMGLRKTWDMFMFWIIQYFLPIAALPDSVMSLLLKRMPVYSPITALMLSVAFIGMFSGLRRVNPQPPGIQGVFVTLFQTLRGMLYMFHWMVVMTSVTARMSVRPKRLKWVKTLHTGTDK